MEECGGHGRPGWRACGLSAPPRLGERRRLQAPFTTATVPSRLLTPFWLLSRASLPPGLGHVRSPGSSDELADSSSSAFSRSPLLPTEKGLLLRLLSLLSRWSLLGGCLDCWNWIPDTKKLARTLVTKVLSSAIEQNWPSHGWLFNLVDLFQSKKSSQLCLFSPSRVCLTVG